MIFSPDVPVLRGEDGRLLRHPWDVSILTCAAVNAGALRRNEPATLPLVGPTMERRTQRLLAVAASRRVEALVLGAWGCGVFRNDPVQIAQAFSEALRNPALAGRFARIVFAIHAPSGESDPNLSAFRAAFPSAASQTIQ